MEDMLIDLGVSALLKALKNPKKAQTMTDVLAKLYVSIERVAATDAKLNAKIREKRG